MTNFTSSFLKKPEIQRLLDSIGEGAATREHQRILPYEEIDRIRAAQLGTLRIRVEDGGQGESLRSVFELAIALGSVDANIAHILRNHFVFVDRYARNSPDGRHLGIARQIADGAIVSLGSGEAQRNVVGGETLRTALRPHQSGWLLTGHKYYTTGSLYSDLINVRAALPDGSPATIVIPTRRNGVEVIDDWDGVGQRLTSSGSVIFSDVEVNPEEVFADVRKHASEGNIPYASTYPQLYLTAVNAGILRNIQRDATELLKNRPHSFYYAPVPTPADDPLLQQTLGQIASAAFAAETIVLAAADALDAAYQAREEGASQDEVATLAHTAALRASHAKIIVDELVIRAGAQLFDLGGASAAQRERNLDRHWRNARTLAAHNPNSYKAQQIGAHLLHDTALPATGFF
ncbi:Acyl-CoA dehydrogenase [Lampropedia hyalina DSM 16112]|jgi:alkylation response protein AidB-like acyl-CoA dehydrogenase|uniref:Acyl-CoA dehydrogenase n=1 Tax=Lampropedia hyalina DSM 16112 TaxID=1122156 RepID=A0A1M4SNF8_9BURK|nr:acyl-CoA dehydrogenase [Lampropedia hyalina]SHE33760.1 Acyl-CoA dehydrogenase [Lampropedia hyalina DSM 16112]